jgi:hypothetical protein
LESGIVVLFERRGCVAVSNAEGELAVFTDRQLHLVSKALAMAAVAIERRPGRLVITSP